MADVDFGMSMAPSIIFHQDAGLPIMALAGVHPGCFELFAQPPIRTISDLKGKTVDVPDGLGSSAHLYMAIMAKHVGLDLEKDINWVTNPIPDAMEIFAQGKIDAYPCFSARKRGAATLARCRQGDSQHAPRIKPWSHYYLLYARGQRRLCPELSGATKRVLRAILKAADLCAAEPERVARQLIDGGFPHQVRLRVARL